MLKKTYFLAMMNILFYYYCKQVQKGKSRCGVREDGEPIPTESTEHIETIITVPA